MALLNDAGELMLYGVIGYDTWDGSGVSAATFVEQVAKMADAETLTIRINSPGGIVTDGMAIYSYLKGHKAKKRIIVDGLAASMASVVAMAGDEIVVPDNAFLMIHNPWTIAIGDADDMRHEAGVLDKMGGSIVAIYAERTGMAADDLRALMDAETWMTGAEAREKGFATSSGQAVEARALRGHQLNILGLRHAERIPGALRAVPLPSGLGGIPAARFVAVASKESTMDNPSPAPAPTPAPAPAASGAGNEETIRQAAVAAERKRAAEIRRAVGIAALDATFADTLVDEGVTIDVARARIFDKLAEGTKPANGATGAVVLRDARDKLREGMGKALLHRAHLGPADAGNEFSGLTLVEMARSCLISAGVARGSHGDRMSMVKLAMTHSTSDFPLILANVANKAMLKGYEEADETFPLWTSKGELPDFKPGKRIDLNAFPSLDVVPEGGEYMYGTIGERGETVQLATYGKMFSITRQAMINDDMSVFTRIPQRMGRAARRTVGNLVYAVLTGNPTMSDGTALFHANHKNLAGSGGAPSVATIDAARAAMALQKDRDAITTALNIRPKYVIAPVTLGGAIRTLVASEFDPAQTQRVPNRVRDLVEVIDDARLDAASTTAYYLVADPSVTDTIEVDYLDGNETPTLEQEEGWKIDGLEFKVRLDAGVKALAWEGFYKNPGA